MAMLRLYKAIRPASGYAVDEAPNSHPRTADGPDVPSCRQVSFTLPQGTPSREEQPVELCYCFCLLPCIPMVRIMKTYPGSGDGLDGLLLAHLLHGGVVLLLVLRHEHLQRPACVHQGKQLLTHLCKDV